MVNSNDREMLRHFVASVWHWLRASYLGLDVAEGVPWPTIHIPLELRDVAVPAWHEFEKEYPLERLLKPIDEAEDDVLTSHGLYGAQLGYKLYLVSRAAERARSGGRGLRRKLIEVIDNIIDSLGPTGLAGGLKELKDALAGTLPEKE